MINYWCKALNNKNIHRLIVIAQTPYKAFKKRV